MAPAARSRFQPPSPRNITADSKGTPEGIADWPFSSEQAAARVKDVLPQLIDLGEGVNIELVPVPAGRYVDADGITTTIDRATEERLRALGYVN